MSSSGCAPLSFWMADRMDTTTKWQGSDSKDKGLSGRTAEEFVTALNASREVGCYHVMWVEGSHIRFREKKL